MECTNGTVPKGEKGGEREREKEHKARNLCLAVGFGALKKRKKKKKKVHSKRARERLANLLGGGDHLLYSF